MTNAADQENANSKPVSVPLSLSDFTLIEAFEGMYPLGESSEGFFTVQRADGTRHQPRTLHDQKEPSHKFVVNRNRNTTGIARNSF